MNYTYIQNFFNLNILYFLFIFQSIKISISSPVDTIINLGLRYSHFSFNSNGDMIIDCHDYPITQERRFFGLKNNGKFYFTDSSNKETPFLTMTIGHNKGRIEGESNFIKLSSSQNNINGREILCGISKLTDSQLNYYVEFYDLNNKNIYYYPTEDVFGFLFSDVFSFLKLPVDSDSHYNYIFTYVMKNSTDNSYYLITRITYFDNNRGYRYRHVQEKTFEVSQRQTVSCFFTENLKYICFYQNKLKNLEAIVYPPSFDTQTKTTIYVPFNTTKDVKKIL